MVSNAKIDRPPEDMYVEPAVHAWRVSRLIRLGRAGPVAEAVADRVNWHEVGKLVERGCPAALAVMIVE